MYATITKPKTPRGGMQGDNRLYISAKLQQEIGHEFVIEQGQRISFRPATIFDHNVKNVKGRTSFKSALDLKPGRHRVVKNGDKFTML